MQRIELNYGRGRLPVELPLGGGAAVAAHGRDDEWIGSAFSDFIDDSPGDLGDAMDAAAAGGEGDRLARPDGAAEGEPLQFGAD